MKKSVIALFVAFVTIAAIRCGSSGTANLNTNTGVPAPNTVPSAVTVTIPANATGQGSAAFGPNPLVVSTGTTVTWVNNDAMPHTATSETGIWDSGILNLGQSFSFKFNSPGTFPYLCTVHGKASMSGTVQVAGNALPTSTPGPTLSPRATPSPSETSRPDNAPGPSITLTPA